MEIEGIRVKNSKICDIMDWRERAHAVKMSQLKKQILNIQERMYEMREEISEKEKQK